MPSLARSVPKPLKVPSLARSVPKPLKVPTVRTAEDRQKKGLNRRVELSKVSEVTPRVESKVSGIRRQCVSDIEIKNNWLTVHMFHFPRKQL